MSDHKPEFLAKEAERLLKDPVLLQALKDIRAEALDELARCDPEDMKMLIGFQQKALLTEEILSQLNRYILALGSE